jgi:hypothetical protein
LLTCHFAPALAGQLRVSVGQMHFSTTNSPASTPEPDSISHLTRAHLRSDYARHALELATAARSGMRPFSCSIASNTNTACNADVVDCMTYASTFELSSTRDHSPSRPNVGSASRPRSKSSCASELSASTRAFFAAALRSETPASCFPADIPAHESRWFDRAEQEFFER